MISRQDAVIVGLILVAIAEIIMLIKKVPFKRNLIVTAFSVYIVFLISIVFFPVFLKSDGYPVDYNFIPFATLKNYFMLKKTYGTVAVLGNIAILIPWGMLFGAVFKKRKALTFWVSTVAFCISIELIQHLMNVIIGYRMRCVDIDDFILNMAGAAIGFALYCLVVKIIGNLRK